MNDWADKVCSHCKHSKWNDEYKDVIPTNIHTCLNPESEFYKVDRSWMCTCEKFESRGN
jgi:hypothetical protein